MKVLLISKGEPIWEIKKLADCIRSKDHEVEFVNPEFSIEKLFDSEFWNKYRNADVVYYRTGFGDAARFLLRDELKKHNKLIINEPWLSNVLISNKIYQSIFAYKNELKVPKTLVGRGRDYALVTKELGHTFILKAANGIQGNKVFKIESELDYKEKLATLEGDILLQEYIPNTGDYRVFVLGGRVVAIFKRIPKEGDFRANISQGGRGESVPVGELYSELSDMALKVSGSLELDIVGIDIIQSLTTKELYFIEANVNPGWKGLETALGLSITEDIADYIINKKQL